MNTWLYLGPKQEPEDTKDGLYPLFTNCRRNPCKPLKEQCKKNQTKFEEEVCFLELSRAGKCDLYVTCVKCHQAGCQEKCKTIDENWQGRAADDETGQRLTCLLNVLFGEVDPTNSTGTGFKERASDTERPVQLELCKTKTYTTEDWELDCLTDLEPPECNLNPFPCETPFTQQYTASPNLFTAPTLNENIGYVEEGKLRRHEFCKACETPPTVDFSPTCPSR
jgi:hypothetical protein